MPGETRQALIEAVRDFEVAIYRDCVPGAHRHRKADIAVREVMEVVMRSVGLRDGTTVTLRPNDSPLLVEPAAATPVPEERTDD